MPPDLVREPRDVVPELEAEPRLADAGRPRDADEPRDAAVDGRVEEVLEQAQLGVAPDQWGVEARDPLRPGDTGDRAERAEEIEQLGLPLDRVAAGVRVGDRRGGDLTGHRVDEHAPRVGSRLNPRRGVDPIADHQTLTGIRERGDLTGDDPGPGAQRRADLLTEELDRLDQLQPGSDRAFGVVLTGHRDAPDRHHGVADELLDRTAVAIDDRLRPLEVVTEQVANVLGVSGLRERRVADQVDEEDRGDAQLGSPWSRRRDQVGEPGRRLDRRRCRPRAGQHRAAAVAIRLAGRMGGRAARAGEDELRSAAPAEARALSVVRVADWAEHSGGLGAPVYHQRADSTAPGDPIGPSDPRLTRPGLAAPPRRGRRSGAFRCARIPAPAACAAPSRPPPSRTRSIRRAPPGRAAG